MIWERTPRAPEDRGEEATRRTLNGNNNNNIILLYMYKNVVYCP